MEFASRIDKPVIFAIGNAPTALIELYDMIEKGIYKPAFVIGVPVGFVNVEAAKELIMETGVPYIVNVGDISRVSYSLRCLNRYFVFSLSG